MAYVHYYSMLEVRTVQYELACNDFTLIAYEDRYFIFMHTNAQLCKDKKYNWI